MRALASYIMRGQMQAMTTVSAMAIMGLVLMPLSWPLSYLSAGGVGLVTLVHGVKEGGKTLLGAVAILALIGMLILGSPALAVGFAISLWLPAWLLASVLLVSRSLLLPIQALLVVGLLVVCLMYILMGEPALWWYNHFINEVIPVLKKAGIDIQDGPELQQQLANVTKLMTGALVISMAWGMVAGLLIARWWQALLYRPGAFAQEFRAFRLGRVIAGVAVLLLIAAMSMKAWPGELASNLLLVMIGILLLQGLAIAHALAAHFEAHRLWLAMLYMLLVVLMPYVTVMLAVAGLIDNWADFRKRFQVRPETPKD